MLRHSLGYPKSPRVIRLSSQRRVIGLAKHNVTLREALVGSATIDDVTPSSAVAGRGVHNRRPLLRKSLTDVLGLDGQLVLLRPIEDPPTAARTPTRSLTSNSTDDVDRGR